MRVHQLLALSGLMLMSNVAVGAKLEHDDVPNSCWKVCGPVVGKSKQCDGMHHDDDRAEIQCICDWNQASSLVPLCEACIAQYRSQHHDDDREDNDDDDNDGDDRNDRDDRDDIHDNDAYDILTSCSLSTTSYNSAAATSAVSSTGTSPSSADATSTSGADAASTSGADATATSGSDAASTSGADSQTTDNAASAAQIPKAAPLAAVVGLGFLAYL